MQPSLTADCSQCCGLCCIIPAYLRSQGFPVDKPAERPCHHLTVEHRCAIHAQRAELGFAGCAAFDCHGAGQWVMAQCGSRPWSDDAGHQRVMAGAWRYWLPRFRIAAMLQTAMKLVPAAQHDVLRVHIAAILDADGPLRDMGAEALERETLALLRTLVAPVRG